MPPEDIAAIETVVDPAAADSHAQPDPGLQLNDETVNAYLAQRGLRTAPAGYDPQRQEYEEAAGGTVQNASQTQTGNPFDQYADDYIPTMGEIRGYMAQERQAIAAQSLQQMQAYGGASDGIGQLQQQFGHVPPEYTAQTVQMLRSMDPVQAQGILQSGLGRQLMMGAEAQAAAAGKVRPSYMPKTDIPAAAPVPGQVQGNPRDMLTDEQRSLVAQMENDFGAAWGDAEVKEFLSIPR